jgi:hypothetical protein
LLLVALLVSVMLPPGAARGGAPASEQSAPDWWREPAAKMTPPAPVIVAPPEPHFDPRSYGAKADGMTYDTASLQKAIDACGGTGGSVVLSQGKYLSAQLTLRGRMTFYLEKGAVLLGGTNAADYPVLIPDNTPAKAIRRSVLYAVKADGLVIDGEGEINGQCPAYGFFVRHADGIEFDHVTAGCLKADVRPWLVKDDAEVKTADCKALGLIPPTRIP